MRQRDRDRVSEREWEREWERVGESGREWESGRVGVRKPLRTAKEPALVTLVMQYSLL